MKIISYSLWGNDPKYVTGAIKNIELAKLYFPDWRVRLYLSRNTKFDYTSDNLDIVYRTEKSSQDGCFWRFEACDSDDIVIIRDLDDRLSERHKHVVDEWLKSDLDIHIIKDHPNHTFPIMAGLWGVRNGILSGISKSIDVWENKSYYTTDQSFLHLFVFNSLWDKSLIHDPFHKTTGREKDITHKRINYEFLGDSFDENDNRREDYWTPIKQYEENKN